MDELAQYLLQNLIVDFEGEVTTDSIRAFLRQDESADARKLMQKIIEEKGIDELLITLADCLAANMSTGINAATIREHLSNYSES